MLQNALDILNSGTPNDQLHDALHALLQEHPYSGPLHALASRSSFLRTEPALETLIRNAAIRANSRKQLHDFVYAPLNDSQVQLETETTATEQEPSSSEINTDIHKPAEENVSELDQQLLSEALSAGAAIDLLAAEAVPESSEVKPPEAETSEPSHSSEESTEPDQETEGTLESESVEEVTEPLPEILPDRMRFSDWMAALNDEVDSEHGDSLSPSGTEPMSSEQVPLASESAMSIIDHFIENEESLVPKRAEFFSPGKAAKNSLIDKDDIVSETLAQVYAAQGSYHKAISTYEKLGLLHPEKSAYFAALIEKLKTELEK